MPIRDPNRPPEYLYGARANNARLTPEEVHREFRKIYDASITLTEKINRDLDELKNNQLTPEALMAKINSMTFSVIGFVNYVINSDSEDYKIDDLNRLSHVIDMFFVNISALSEARDGDGKVHNAAGEALSELMRTAYLLKKCNTQIAQLDKPRGLFTAFRSRPSLQEIQSRIVANLDGTLKPSSRFTKYQKRLRTYLDPSSRHRADSAASDMTHRSRGNSM